MIKSVVITGATSLLGTALVEECIKNNIKVLAIVSKGSNNVKRVAKHTLIDILELNLCDYATYVLEGVFKEKYDAFVHLAWAATNGDVERNKLKAQADNITYSLDAVNLAEKFGCQVFIGAGSQAEYGRTEEILTEKTPVFPETPYGMAKLCASGMTRIACKEKGIRHIWTRILSSYGPRYQARTVLNYTIIELLNGRSPKLSAGDQIWDFIYSEDVARAFCLLMDKGHDGEVYVIGQGQSKTLRSYLIKTREMLIKLEGREMPDLDLGAIPYSDGTVMHLACDISKLKADTGFSPLVSFEDGIKNTILWNKQEWINK